MLKCSGKQSTCTTNQFVEHFPLCNVPKSPLRSTFLMGYMSPGEIRKSDSMTSFISANDSVNLLFCHDPQTSPIVLIGDTDDLLICHLSALIMYLEHSSVLSIDDSNNLSTCCCFNSVVPSFSCC